MYNNVPGVFSGNLYNSVRQFPRDKAVMALLVSRNNHRASLLAEIVGNLR